MSLQTKLGDLITALGTDYKVIVARIGTLASLTTTDKSSLVAAVNEVKAAIPTLTSLIDDSTTTSTTKVWSANKATAAIAAAVSALVGGAGAAYDTLVELQSAIQTDDTAISGILTSLSKRVRVDAAQSFTGTELTQGQDNLNVYSRTQLGDPDTDLAAAYATAKA